MTEQPTAFQPAIFNARMESVARRMADTLLRRGRSGVINTARDFSCSLVTARGELRRCPRVFRSIRYAAPI
jgi:N-methylhydantoinase B/oxoprolinase/acetone carboxylase alpha subunit